MSGGRDQDLPWLKLYTSILDDDKVLLLTDVDFGRFVKLLCAKRAGVLDSDAPMRELRVARKLRLEVPELLNTMQRLIDVGLIDERWHPIAWRKRQFPDALTGAERMRRYRDKQRSDEEVTAPSQKVTRSDVLDIETESEEDTEADTPPADGGSAEGERRARAPRRPSRRMPDDWTPSTEFLCWAATECPLVDLTAELRALRDHEFKVSHSDWDATARNWIRREQKTLAQRASRQQPQQGRESRFNRMQRRQDEI